MKKYLFQFFTALFAVSLAFAFSGCGDKNRGVPVQSVTLSQTSRTLAAGGSGFNISATIMPESAANNTITWAVSGEGIVRLSRTEGKAVSVTPVSEGTVLITARAGGISSGPCTVTVAPPGEYKRVTNITLESDHDELMEGVLLTITAALTPPDAHNQEVTWELIQDGEFIEKVGETSLSVTIKGVARGGAGVKAVSSDGPAATRPITVIRFDGVAVSGVSLNRTSGILEPGGTLSLTAAVAPENASIKTVIWSSSNNTVATVDGNPNGTATVNAVGAGTAVISVMTGHLGFTAQCAITVDDSGGNPGGGSGNDLKNRSDPDPIVPMGIFSQWAPGIPEGIPHYTKIHSAIDASVYGDGVTDATEAIQNAIDAAGLAARSSGEPQVVYLPSGIYMVNGPIILNRSFVALRGAGPSTVIRGVITGNQYGVFTIGYLEPQYSSTKVVNVTNSPKVGDTSITVADSGSFKAGDILVLDRLADDGGDPTGESGLGTEWRLHGLHMRGPKEYHHNQGPISPSGYRPVRQYVEIKSVSGNTLQLSNRINIAFPNALNPQVWKAGDFTPVGGVDAGDAQVQYSGIENMKLQSVTWTYPHSPSIVLHFNSSYSWVKNVESDGGYGRNCTNWWGTTEFCKFASVHIRVRGFRNHVTGCYVYSSSNNHPGGTGYGIEFMGSDCLIDNNIAEDLCKPVEGYVSGGGNVIAYNYVPNTAEYEPGHGWQETGIDTSHAAYSHSDLFEGNYAVNISTDSTAGNNGWYVIFRNHAWGRNKYKNTGAGSPLHALGIYAWNNEHASIGNVWLEPEDVANGLIGNRVDQPSSPNGGWVVYRLGAIANGWGPRDPSDAGYWYDFNSEYPNGWVFSKFQRHLDYNYFNDNIYDNPANTVKTLPDSLYLKSAPDYFAGYVWPPVNPSGTNHAERVSGLPAADRYGK
ncbi:MAG: Ig-like domain-containing protein [Treponema sp.]|jgi:uncharacterized protein YjdB|nr:Ig-like domain-containing protein [Treponema sp.]